MRNGAFVTWLLGWWLIQDVFEYLYFLEHGKPHEMSDSVGWILLGIWILVASIVYEGKERE